MILLAMIGIIIITGVWGDFKRKKQIFKKEGKEISFKEFFTKGYTIAIITGIICVIMPLMFVSTNSNNNTNKWSNLTKEEKAWYNRNYGDGKAEKINKAIQGYKISHYLTIYRIYIL